MAAGVAALAVISAIVVNWLWGPVAGDSPYAPLQRPGQPVSAEFEPEVAAIDRLPERITRYETIARQPIPGQGRRAAEAIYTTLQMGVESQRPTNSYARVESFISFEKASARLLEILQPYGGESSESLLGAVKAKTGFSEDRGALVTAWRRGNDVTFVKTSFRTEIPVADNDILERLHGPVVDAVDAFQRTGRQGVSK